MLNVLPLLAPTTIKVDKAEKLRQVIEDLTIKINNETSVSITVSVGCCHQRADKSDIDQLMHQADTALYQAKIAGRNRVALHQ
ncbi:GGDEF domain-containing protein [Vibrio sp.]|uniref:GGDEF domain-containing protein n=1 Tax=Vibrio sp. TaxID=678 RepID=UPI003AA919F4